MKSKFGFVLWASYILTMAASIGHLAWTFGTLEPAGLEWAGWLPALAVDAGLGALAYAIQQRKRAGRRAWSLWGGVAVFTAVSGYANFRHAAAGGAAWWDALTLSAILPLLVVYLGEIISSDDAAAADAAEKERGRIERTQAAALAKAERAQAEAERAQAAQMPDQAPQPAALVAQDAAAQPHDAAAVRSAAARAAARARWDAVKAERTNGVSH